MTHSASCVVMGGGVSGLVSARELATYGFSVTVMESAPHWGGAVSPLTIDGFIADAGAESISVARRSGLDLIHELGLDDDVIQPRRADPRIAFIDGLREIPPTVLGIPACLDDERLRAILGNDSMDRLANEQDWPIDTQTTIGQLVRERLGDDVVRRLVDPIVHGVHATPADQADLATLLPNIDQLIRSSGSLVGAAAQLRAGLGPSGNAIVSLKGGMHRLVSALVDSCTDLGVTMLLSNSASSLERVGEKWIVTDQTGRRSQFDLAILALPPAQTGQLLNDVNFEISQSFEKIEMTAVSLATLSVDSAELNAFPVGPGLLVSTSRTDVTAKALTHANAKWDWWDDVLPKNRHILRLSFGRSGQPALSPSRIEHVVANDARVLLGLIEPWTVREVVVTQWESSLVRPSPGHAARVGFLSQQVEQIPGLAVLSGALCGNGLAGVIELARRQSKRLRDLFSNQR